MIETWAPELTSILAGVTGVKQVHPYDKLPGKIGVNGSIIWLPVSGPVLTYGLSAPNIQITQVQITLYMTVQLLPQGVGKAIPFIDRIPRALAANMTLNGKANYILPRTDGPAWEGPAYLAYNGDQTLTGINFWYNVKEMLNFTVS